MAGIRNMDDTEETEYKENVGWQENLFIFSGGVIFKKYLFLERGEGKEKERERNTVVWERNIYQVSLAHPKRGPGLQPRHVLWPGIELATSQFAGCHSIHWATPARAGGVIFNSCFIFYIQSFNEPCFHFHPCPFLPTVCSESVSGMSLLKHKPDHIIVCSVCSSFLYISNLQRRQNNGPQRCLRLQMELKVA